MGESSLLQIAIQYGLPTVLLFVVGVAYYYKDKAFGDEQRARIEDAKIFYERMAKAQEALGAIAAKFSDENEIRVLTRELLGAAEALRDIAEEMKQRERERDLRGAASIPGGQR